MKDHLPKTGSLGARAMQAGGWNILITVVTYVLRLASNLIMTRLLVPEAFGMIALASTILTALALFTDIGVGRSISREPDGEDPKFLRVAWVVKIIRGSVVAAGVFVAAFLLWIFGTQVFPEDTVYAQPEMPGLLALVALSPILLGAVSTNWDLAIRRLEYRRFAVILILSQVGSLIAMVLFALLSPTVWALMCGMLVNGVLQCLMSHRYLPGTGMKIVWDAEIAGRLWHFGKWLIGASVLTFVGKNADKLILGGLLGAADLGIYVIAQIWIESGKALIARLSEGVGFPVIAEVMRTRPDDVPRLYQKYQRVIDLICVSAFLIVYFLGQALVDFLYTPTYALAGAYLQLLSPVFLITRFDALGGLVLNAGNSRAVLILAGIRAIAICILMFMGYKFLGVKGALMGTVFAPIVAVPYSLFLTRPILGAWQTNSNIVWLLISTISTLLVFLTISI